MTTKITSKGQLTLPKLIRQHLNVGSGDQVVFKILGDGTVTVQPVLHIKDLKGILNTGNIHLSDEDIKNIIRNRENN